MEEFRVEHTISDDTAARLINDRQRQERQTREQYPQLYIDENLYVQFGKWAFAKNKTYAFGQPKQSYLPIVQEYMRDEKIQDPESMEILIKLLSTKRQGALTR